MTGADQNSDRTKYLLFAPNVVLNSPMTKRRLLISWMRYQRFEKTTRISYWKSTHWVAMRILLDAWHLRFVCSFVTREEVLFASEKHACIQQALRCWQHSYGKIATLRTMRCY